MTTPASTWRNAYITSRLPYSSGTTGQICSAPFVLNKALGTPTADPDRPFEIANGLITDASYSNIIPIAVPPEYAILETWVVLVGTHGIIVNTGPDILPVMSIYGKTTWNDNHDGNMPDDHATIANWPANLREWWMPLPMTDRTTPSSTGTGGEFNTGVNDNDFTAVQGSGSFEMSAFEFKPRMIPIPSKDGSENEPHAPVARIGDGTVAAQCFPSQTFFLNGSESILATVVTAMDEASSGTNFDGGVFLMGRFHG